MVILNDDDTVLTVNYNCAARSMPADCGNRFEFVEPTGRGEGRRGELSLMRKTKQQKYDEC